jgi:cellulose synthase/poly-beta-1,6-N-acetylglucosamine synthase-like glycosyltransferase
MHASEVFCTRRGIVKSIPREMVNDDAFLAVAAKKAGYLIRCVPECEVKIFGPQTIPDYIGQRRRIIAGHYQVRLATGEFSQYVPYSLLVRPTLTLRTLVRYTAAKRDVLDLLVAQFVELASNLLALFDSFRRRSRTIWSISSTTKTAAEI